jgi:hypothetical protein
MRVAYPVGLEPMTSAPVASGAQGLRSTAEPHERNHCVMIACLDSMSRRPAHQLRQPQLQRLFFHRLTGGQVKEKDGLRSRKLS